MTDSFEKLQIPGFVIRRLRNGGFSTLDELRDAVDREPERVLSVPYIGPKTLAVIQEALGDMETEATLPAATVPAAVAEPKKKSKAAKPKKKAKKGKKEPAKGKAKGKKDKKAAKKDEKKKDKKKKGKDDKKKGKAKKDKGKKKKKK